MITISVPAKIHLLGEHTSVHGKPALLAAIDKYISVSISSSKIRKGKKEQWFEDFKKTIEEEVKKQCNITKIPPYSVSVQSEIPVGSGLGSSAALSAAFTAALLSFLKIPWDKKIVYEIAYVGEAFFHGNPSGGDLAAVVNGGLLYFRKEFEFLKTFSHLPFKIHTNIKDFFLLDSGKPVETTKELVAHVGNLKKEQPEKIEKIFNHQEQLVKDMVIALKNGDEDELIRCIREGAQNLEKLEVIGPQVKKIIREVESIGGAAKIMGGGGVKAGGGMLLVYCKDKKNILEYSKKNNIQLSTVKIDTEGIKNE